MESPNGSQTNETWRNGRRLTGPVVANGVDPERDI